VLATIEKEIPGHPAGPGKAFIEALDPLAAAALFDIVLAQGASRTGVTGRSIPSAIRSPSGKRLGVASTFLAERVRPGDGINGKGLCGRRRTISACPPIPRCPIVMIGPGQPAIAPFRAVPCRSAWRPKASGRNWLFYGPPSAGTATSSTRTSFSRPMRAAAGVLTRAWGWHGRGTNKEKF